MQRMLWKLLVSETSQPGQNSHMENKCLPSAFPQGAMLCVGEQKRDTFGDTATVTRSP